MTLPDAAGVVRTTGGAVVAIVVTCDAAGGCGAVPVHPHAKRRPIKAKITITGIKSLIGLMLHVQAKKVFKNTDAVPEPRNDGKFFFIVFHQGIARISDAD